MRLRELELKDSPLMLEWMQDSFVVEHMGTDFSQKTIDDCEDFILHSESDTRNYHRAIVDDRDVYMGTVSLKNIDYKYSNAEFAITVRREAMGLGYSKYAMDEMIKFGLEKLNLSSIYWYVSKYNKRALHFYDKNGFRSLMPAELRKYAFGGVRSFLPNTFGTLWKRTESERRQKKTTTKYIFYYASHGMRGLNHLKEAG